MNIKKSLFAALVSVFSLSAMAQDAPKTEYVFQPHWYIQANVGGQYTLGEVGFGDLLSPNAQVAVGYNFNKILGARLAVNAFQSKAGSDVLGQKYTWKWNYVAPTIDITANLSNLICGYNPTRLVDITAFIGGGVNIGFKNDEAATANNAMYAAAGYPAAGSMLESQYLRHLWDGTKVRALGKAGLAVDFKVSERVAVGAEVAANVTTDKYNSKKAGNADWYFNGLVGIKVNLGKTHTTRTIEPHVCPECPPCPEPRVVEKIVEKVVEKVPEVDPLRETIFYAIRVSDPNANDIIDKVVAWCAKYPTHGVSVRGYADKGTGNHKINQGYAKKRADKVANILKARGIDATRISVSSYGDLVQPFAENDKNRCVIIIGE